MLTAPYCQCPELIVYDPRRKAHVFLLPPLEHSCEYRHLRNALMTRAQREANTDPDLRMLPAQGRFSTAMDRLVARAWEIAALVGYPEPGPERARACHEALGHLAKGTEQRMLTPRGGAKHESRGANRLGQERTRRRPGRAGG